MAQSARNFFDRKQKTEIKQAILQAELDTSGEIRVHIENHCETEVLDRASIIFHKLKMDKTELRNGVLFYLAVKDKKFAILGDKGINAEVPENFWDDIKKDMTTIFQEGDFTQGLVKAIAASGQQLKKHFPHHSDDINELSDEISFGS
jgi:uncharacterized membrane protein